MATSVRYVRLSSGADGHSHFSDEVFSLEGIEAELSGGVASSARMAATHCEVRLVPSGWQRDWAPAAHPVLAIYLSGEGEIEASDGEVRRIVPGLMLLAADTTGRGHRVRVASEQPVTVLQIHLAPGAKDD